MKTNINAQNLINKEYPIRLRSKFVPMVRRAYSAIDQLITENEVLNWSVADNLVGNLINTAVEFEFKRMIDKGDLKLEYNVSFNKRKNHKHIELISQNTISTISQVKNKYSVPRKAIFRNNLSCSNQLMFDIYDNSLNFKESPKYILLTHGGKNGNVDFLNLGMPQPYNKGWIYCFDLFSEFEQISNEQYEAQNNEEEIVELKDNIRLEVLKGGRKK